MHRAVLAAAIVTGVAIAGYLAYQQANRSPYALEIDAIKDTTESAFNTG